MKADEVISAGNTFSLSFFVGFAFVYFAIIEPHFARDHSPEQHIENTLQQIAATEIQLQERLDRIRYRESYDIRSAAISTRRLARSKPGANMVSRVQKDEEAEALIREQLVQLGVAHQALSKAKSEKKNYSIPLISVSIDEETLLKFFPVLVLIGLIRLLFYRASLLRVVLPNIKDYLPIWVAPLPFGKASISFCKWVIINLFGFIEVGTIVLLTLRFVFLYARENHALLKLVAAETVLVGTWAVAYLFIVVRAMLQAPLDSKTTTLEFEVE